MKAMVLAAGVGSRLDPLTSKVPKPLVPITNVPVMEHILKLVKRHDITDVAANLHYMPDKIVEYFGDGKKLGLNLHFKKEEKLTGDAGGVRACRQFLQDGTFIVLMGDLLTDADLTDIVRQHKAKKALASIAVKAMEDVSRFGVVVRDANGFITGFQEKPSREEALSDLISTGIYILEPEIFDHIPAEGEYGFGRQLFPSLVKAKLPVLAVEIETYWSDVGTISQYKQSNVHALNGEVRLDLLGQKHSAPGYTLWTGEGTRIADSAPDQPNWSGKIMLGKNCHVEEGVKLEGDIIIADNVRIGRGTQLKNTIVWDNTVIGANAQLSDCVLAEGYRVETGARHTGQVLVEGATPVACS